MPIYNSKTNKGSLTNVNSRHLFDSLKDYINGCTGTVYVIVPFISNNVLEKLLDDVVDNEVCIVTSWRADHLATGVSSLELYPLCKTKGWTLFVNPNIHCKIYSDSFNSCFISSANCTNRALIDIGGNIESCVVINELDVGNRVELNKLVYESTRVDDRIFDQYEEWFKTIEKKPLDELSEPKIADVTPFYVSQLPAIDCPDSLWEYVCTGKTNGLEVGKIEHDLAIYSSNPFGFTDKESFLDDIRKKFLSHPFIRSLDKEITYSGIRFGQFKIIVQNNCSDVPLPYRKDLSNLAHNLYEWFVGLFPDIYYWDVPGSHSQVLHRRKEQDLLNI